MNGLFWPMLLKNSLVFDGWIRHKLRCALWRGAVRHPYTRVRKLMKGAERMDVLGAQRASSGGAWSNSGASHINQAFPKPFFDRLDLVPLLDTV